MSRSSPGPLPPAERKADYVRQMFGDIARRYDLMNCLMTGRRDRVWRRYTVLQLDLGPPPGGPIPGRPKRVLDVATGTGDLALEVLRQQPAASVSGLDVVPRMLTLAQQKAQKAGVELALTSGDALRLPFPDATFDAVVSGFAMRNVTDVAAAMAEMARVTRSGGRMACLEIARPRVPVFDRLFELYFYRLVPSIGHWIAGQRAAYTYLPYSVGVFMTPPEVVAVMRRTGWQDVRCRHLMLGAVTVHTGVRSEYLPPHSGLPITAKNSTMRIQD